MLAGWSSAPRLLGRRRWWMGRPVGTAGTWRTRRLGPCRRRHLGEPTARAADGRLIAGGGRAPSDPQRNARAASQLLTFHQRFASIRRATGGACSPPRPGHSPLLGLGPRKVGRPRDRWARAVLAVSGAAAVAGQRRFDAGSRREQSDVTVAAARSASGQPAGPAR